MEKNKKNRGGSDVSAPEPAVSRKPNHSVDRTPMPIDQRAKQFMPFEAVTGLKEALREKERQREQREKYR